MDEKEKEVVNKFLEILEQRYKPAELEDEITEVFISEFGIEPVTVTPARAIRRLKVDETAYHERLDKILDILGHSTDYFELNLFIEVKRIRDVPVGSEDWEFDEDFLTFRKYLVLGDKKFQCTVRFERDYDDC